MSLSRSKPISSRRDCKWECVGVASGGWKKWECARGCGQGRITPPGQEPGASRCSGLSRTGGGLKASRPQPISPDRDRKRRDRGLDTDLKAYVLELPCLLADHPDHACRGDVVAHHVRHKNHAGDWTERGGERMGNLLPTCDALHQDIHDHGKTTVAERYGLDALEDEARRVGLAYLSEAA